MILAVLFAATLAVICVIAVALPFLREPEPVSDAADEPDPSSAVRLQRAEARDRALAALKELERDHREGRVADSDYRAQLRPLRQEAARALAAAEEQPEQQRR